MQYSITYEKATLMSLLPRDYELQKEELITITLSSSSNSLSQNIVKKKLVYDTVLKEKGSSFA